MSRTPTLSQRWRQQTRVGHCEIRVGRGAQLTMWKNAQFILVYAFWRTFAIQRLQCLKYKDSLHMLIDDCTYTWRAVCCTHAATLHIVHLLKLHALTLFIKKLEEIKRETTKSPVARFDRQTANVDQFRLVWYICYYRRWESEHSALEYNAWELYERACARVCVRAWSNLASASESNSEHSERLLL